MNFVKLPAASALALTLAACATTPAPVVEAPVLPVAEAPAPDFDYDAALRRTALAYDTTGMVAAVMVDGDVVYEGAVGLAEEGTNRPVTTDMLFPIASISKAFTTTALAILVDRGQVGWDEPVRSYIPEFAMWDPWVSENFTVRDALTHRSGLPLGAGDLLIWPDGDAEPADVIAALPHLRPTTGFRSEYAYDNLLYIVAGEIVTRVSGQDWAEFVTDEILEPVGMDACAAESARIPTGAPVVTGHERAAGAEDGLPVDPRLAFSPTWNAAGGIWCNLDGMMAWSKFWLDGGVTGDGVRLVSEVQARELWKPVTLQGTPGGLRNPTPTHFVAYALGWSVRDFEGAAMVGHGGGAPGVVTNLTLLPEHDIAIFAGANDYRGAPSTFATHVASALLGVNDDVIGERGAAFAEAEARGVELISGTNSAPANAAPPTLPLSAYVGTYRDPWYGNVVISQTADGALYIDMGRSEILDGALTHYEGDRFAAFWPDSSLKADAFVDFAVENGAVTGVTMIAISELTDFSYDFHDLQLQRVD